MGRIAKYLCLVLCFIVLLSVFFRCFGSFYDERLGSRYYDAIGEAYGSTEKNQGLILQQQAINRGDNLLIFGSSELSSVLPPFNPGDFFKGKKGGFQVNLIGRGYSQSIIHAVNIGGLGGSLRGKKIVIIVSPQWFDKEGLLQKNFNMNFSELQFCSLMFNDEIDKSVKLEAAKRIAGLAGFDQQFGNVKAYCDLYSAHNIFSKAILEILMPYYRFQYYLLSLKDKITASRVLDSYSGYGEYQTPKDTEFNWEEELKKAEEEGRKQAGNNEFAIENSYYDLYIKGKEEWAKSNYQGISYEDSPEYQDFKVLLDTCRDVGVNPLIISVPMNGKWYDYCGYDRNSRQEYYKRINETVASYGFDIADFSEYEYEDYFLRDTMHLGWKGWVYVDEAIDRFYHENQ